MDHHEQDCQAHHALESRCAKLEETLAQMRGELRDAIRAQDELHVQLRAALRELSQVLSQPYPPAALERLDQDQRRLESRMMWVEQRLDRTAEKLQGILGSRIWRALVRVG